MEGAPSFKEEFHDPIVAEDGKAFGKNNQLTFELFRGGTFLIDGISGFAQQKSDSYRDSAIIRSTQPLPKKYKVSVVIGQINYDLKNIAKYSRDREYREGPKNENGCYLIAITDQAPTEHYTNDWWHQHRKLVIDVDNNVWGHGMPNPIFMVYFDENNELVSYNGGTDKWEFNWVKGVEYQKDAWYKIEIEKTSYEYVLSISDDKGVLLEQSRIPIDEVWHTEEKYQEYFVTGEPHENYYEGDYKIRSIEIKSID